MSRVFDAVRDLEKVRAANSPASACSHANVDVPTRPHTGNMVSVAPSHTASVPENQPVDSVHARDERRKHKRAAMNLGVRVRPANSIQGNFQEVLRTMNASRQGLFFTSSSAHYFPGMSLRIMFPYSSAHDSVTASEIDGKVARIQDLGRGRWGVAVLLGPLGEGTHYAAAASPAGQGRANAERRFSARYPASASAIVLCSASSTRLQARCSDLSLGGCYVDSLNPFPEGTPVHLRLQRGDELFETNAYVRSSHPGMGMGLSFHEPTPEQKVVLNDWLCCEPRGDRRAPVPGVEASVRPRHVESIDQSHTLPILIMLLQSKGILTQADAAFLLSRPDQLTGGENATCKSTAFDNRLDE